MAQACAVRRGPGEEARRELSGWLADLAAHTDSGLALVEAFLEEMRRRRIVAPAALWNAVYLDRVVAELRARGEEVPEEYLRHLSPLEWEHITLTGVYRWNLGENEAPGEPQALRKLLPAPV